MKYYTISVKVPEGSGDYGSDFLTLVNARPMREKDAILYAENIARSRQSQVLVFRGKDIGKLVQEVNPQCDI